MAKRCILASAGNAERLRTMKLGDIITCSYQGRKYTGRIEDYYCESLTATTFSIRVFNDTVNGVFQYSFTLAFKEQDMSLVPDSEAMLWKLENA